ncbi:hypothetical protein EB796_001392 [Bugula neritina]|uniref:Uncharacterized protein n=1 Tax=Bugula neritina TaxID=10212 RepID=A0A7J7KQB3_BUGNE|nr:hypothetical protein EB796_001392 [Bugula neritina]
MREISTDRMSRPRTSHSNYSVFTSNKVHPWSSDYLFSSKNKKRNSLIVSTESNNESSSVHFNNNNSAFTLDGYSKESCMKQSKSDYTVVSYFRSDSQDKLLKRQSSTLSDSSFIFDNPAYVNSHEMLTGQVDVTAAAMPYSYNRTGYYGRLSRSLDSIRDVFHDSNPLYGAIPGSVVSQSEESVCGTCTVRNIVLDECSQAWDESWLEDDTITTQDDSPTTHYHQASNFPKQYRLYIIGGQKISTRSSVTEDHLMMWKADIYSKSSKNEKMRRSVHCPDKYSLLIGDCFSFILSTKY